MSGVVVWLTGLPASGKSSLFHRVAARLRSSGACVVELDGDELRERVFTGCGYDDESRARFYEGLAQLAALLARQRMVVLVAATAHRRAWRRRAREVSPSFVEVLLDVPPDVCAARDPRGLYRRAKAGEVVGLPGVGVPYDEPEWPDVIAGGGEDEAAIEAIVVRIRAIEPVRMASARALS
ncbi:MAG: adenylyl-sulfate kinase [Deltaproteobacteria bacterium]|nr:adenylyl-sulfate kinase [Deltaproteobacteria bacterium]